MKKLGLVIKLVIFFLTGVHAQENGIRFEHGLNWQQIKDKARKEKKFIFVDCYATWCGPCKYMNKNIFPLGEVGEFFNSHFISVKVQMDVTDRDSADIKEWYKCAKEIETKYAVTSFPTYLFFSSAGVPVHRIVGATDDGKEFLSKSEDALNPDKQYYSIIGNYQKHIRDSLFLRNAVLMSLASQDQENAVKIGGYYIDCLKDPFSKVNLDLIMGITKSSKDKGFQFLLKNMNRIGQVLGNNNAELILVNIISEEEVDPIFAKNAPSANWNDIYLRLKAKYPTQLVDHVIALQKPAYFEHMKQWSDYEAAVLAFMNGYGDKLGDFETNGKAWGVFQHSSNQSLLIEAAKWSKRTLINYPNVGQATYIDTYANLLYKLGDKSNAISWERKAIEIEKNESQRKGFENILQKMENGDKTWK